MSDWLIQGVAAAKADDKEMAHFYLERALSEWEIEGDLYGNVEMDDRMEAYYWLSHVSDDPRQKRDYLEEVLAINPMHPDARRELAILNGRLKPEDIVNPDRVATAVAPEATPDASEVRRFVCPNCGGKMSYDVVARALICEYCGHRLSEAEARESGVVEQDFVATIYTAQAHRWELPTKRSLRCESCGAHFVLPPAQVAGSCPFCASAHVVESAIGAELIEPQGVVPFQFEADACVQHIRDWLKTREFAPGDLYTRSAIVRPRAVYVPFWVFDVGGGVSWSGLMQEYRQADGKMVWVQRTGQELVLDDNLLVAASQAVSAELLTALSDEATPGAYDVSHLTPYNEDFLANWPAEIYQVAMANASLQARQKAFEHAKRRTSGGSAAGAHELTLNSAGIVINTYQLALLPVWISAYRYKNKNYPLAVNGQSGAVHGQVPRSGLQRLAAGILGDG